MRKILNLSKKSKEIIVLSVTFCVAFLVFHFAGKVVFPFALALVLAVLVRRVADKLKTVTGLSTRAGGFACLVAVYLLCILSLVFVVRFSVQELGNLFEMLPSIYSDKIQPQLNKILPDRYLQIIYDFTKNISSKLISFAAQTVIELPQIFFSVFVGVIASFFICFDYQNIKNTLIGKLSSKTVTKIKTVKKAVENTIVKMLGCYGFLFAVTFALLFVGFLLFNIKHAFVLALVIALADALPMLGVGTALIPWACICFTVGKLPLGIGLTCIFLIIVIVRNVLEPKIIGKKIGIHPLLSLFVMYVGISLGGFLTAIFLLFAITVIKHLNTEIK